MKLRILVGFMILLYCNIFAGNTRVHAAVTKFPYELSQQGWTLSESIKWTDVYPQGRTIDNFYLYDADAHIDATQMLLPDAACGKIAWEWTGTAYQLKMENKNLVSDRTSLVMNPYAGPDPFTVSFRIANTNNSKVTLLYKYDNRYTTTISEDGVYTVKDVTAFEIVATLGKDVTNVPAITVSDLKLDILTQPAMSIYNFYDYDGDGKTEYLLDNLSVNKISKNIIEPLFTIKPDGIDRNDTQPQFCNINNDGYPDIRFLTGGKIAVNNSEGNYKALPFSNAPYPCDYNNDGKVDLLKDSRYVYHQKSDATFQQTELVPVTSESDDLAYNRWVSNNHSSGIGLGNLGGDVGVPIGDGSSSPSPVRFESLQNYYSMDFNKDGHEDLILGDDGLLLLNRGNNRFLVSKQEGSLYPKDLNGDFITDYVMYDPYSKKVTTQVFDKAGSVKKQMLMQNLTMDEDIYFFDFDRDGDVDILLPFSQSSGTGEYCYLVLCINDGNGNFKINEDNTFRKKWKFNACTDVDNDGYYDVVATEVVDNNLTHVYLLKGASGNRFVQPNEVLFSAPLKIESVIIGDFNNEGGYQAICSNETKSYLYTFDKKVANIAPERLDAPAIVADPASGLLKITWQAGHDDHSSTVDLTYALRIGSEPGKGDVFYAHANADGSRRNLLPGNMDGNLDKIVNVAGWKPGNYYIAVQAIDPMRKGSVWSAETVYKHEVPGSPIYISNKSITTSDTLTVAYDGGYDPTITFNWDLGGGRIIESTDANATLKVVFDTQGSKTITLQTTSSNGFTAVPRSEDVYVYPTRFIDDQSMSNSGMGRILKTADMNGNGKVEILTENGVFTQDETLKFEKAPGIYNTNLTFNGYGGFYETRIFDYNRDGLPDFIGYINGGKGNLLLNKGGNKFEVTNFTNTVSHDSNDTFADPYFGLGEYADLDNDGILDYIDSDGNYPYIITLYRNQGNYTYQTALTINKWYQQTIQSIVDFNNDNLLDLVIMAMEESSEVQENNRLVYKPHYYVGINKGDFEFDFVALPRHDSYRISSLEDLNNDGIKDILWEKYDSDGSLCVQYSQNKSISYSEFQKIDLPEGFKIWNYKIADVDNNGYLDIAEHKVLYNYADSEWVLYTYASNFGNNRSDLFFVDMNNDGTPDFIDEKCNYEKSLTRITNRKPGVPLNVSAIQTDDGFVTIGWDAAHDEETPAVQMRYNLSVRKQGIDGDNSYIISPLNNLSDVAQPATCGYLRGNQFKIPVSAMPVGKYDVQIQAIDGWDAHSAFSQPFTLEVTPKPLLKLPRQICEGKVVTISYNGTVTSDVHISWGDAQVLNDDGKYSYEVVWNTSGTKTLEVTSEGKSTSVSFVVKRPINADFTLPPLTLKETETFFEISDDIFATDREFSFKARKSNSVDFVDPDRLGIEILRKKNTKIVKAIFAQTGEYTLGLSVADSECGDVTMYRDITVKETFAKPQISLITIDPSTGKNKINWQFTGLPDFITDVMVYKEGSRYNQFDLIGQVNPAAESFIDLVSNPTITTSRYQIRLNTSFGVQTNPGDTHQSVHLMINKGMGESWNLIWTPYEGAIIDNYRILRGTSPDNLTEIASVSGSASSYSDFSAPNGILYYALEFSSYYENIWEPMNASMTTRSKVLVTAKSNTVNVANATNVVFVNELYIRSIEPEVKLNPQQPELHLYADVYPVTAAYKNVNWTVTGGSDIAYITPRGLLVAYGNKNGTVRVRATSVDGSDRYAEVELPADEFVPSGLEVVAQDKMQLLLYPSPAIDVLHITGIPACKRGSVAYLIGMNGQLWKEVKITGTEYTLQCGDLPSGIYAIKVVNEKGIMSKTFIKQ